MANPTFKLDISRRRYSHQPRHAGRAKTRQHKHDAAHARRHRSEAIGQERNRNRIDRGQAKPDDRRARQHQDHRVSRQQSHEPQQRGRHAQTYQQHFGNLSQKDRRQRASREQTPVEIRRSGHPDRARMLQHSFCIRREPSAHGVLRAYVNEKQDAEHNSSRHCEHTK